MLIQLVEFAAIGLAIYLIIAGALLVWPIKAASGEPGPAVRELHNVVTGGALAEPAPAQNFVARDGMRRLYRRYDFDGTAQPDVLILLHGSGSDSRYLARLATLIAERGQISVVTLDLRGHGREAGRRGDIDRLDRQEHDIVDLLEHVRSAPAGRIFLGGHSIGGGLAIRYVAGAQQPKPDGLVLIAPYIHRRSPAARRGSGGWATPFISRFAGIDMMQRLGIHAFDAMPVIRFEIPPNAQDGTETPLYSWRLFTSVTPRANWRREIAKIGCPALVLAAQNDSIFNSAGYAEIFASAPRATVEVLPDINHFQLVVSDDVPQRIGAWIAQLRGEGPATPSAG